jgi:crotonobetainyl-CoA:carnitine CoA-transferase CaiB-like acyl-CoA transferase
MASLHQFLQGVKILDLSSYLPGPLTSLLLADMGADIIKVERPQGDPMSELGPPSPSGFGVFYDALNAGKQILRLDLRDAADHAVFDRLAAEADVVIEGFRPGVADRLRVGYQDLCRINPKIIYCSISGYGANGPRATATGHDGNYLAEAGLLDRNGAPPPIPDPSVSDVAGSLFAGLTIVSALHGRTRSGEGCHIDIGLSDAAMALQIMQVAALGATGDVPRFGRTYLTGGAAYYRAYATRDGRHVVVCPIEPKFWRAFCDAAGRPDWIVRQEEPLPQTELIADLARFFADIDLAECMARFDGTESCVSAVADLAEALAAPQIAARDLVRRTQDGALQALYPARIDAQAPQSRKPAEPGDKSATFGRGTRTTPT